MNYPRLATKYTQALREAIKDQEELLRAGQSYQTFLQLCVEEPNLIRFLSDPIVPLEARRTALDAAMQLCDPPEAVARLANLLLERNRFMLLPEIVAQFTRKVDEWLNRVEVTVYTATPLTEELRVKLRKSLELFTNRTVRMSCIVDLDIMGGLIVNMYGFSFDFSYRTRLERLKEKLLLEETLVYGD